MVSMSCRISSAGLEKLYNCPSAGDLTLVNVGNWTPKYNKMHRESTSQRSEVK